MAIEISQHVHRAYALKTYDMSSADTDSEIIDFKQMKLVSIQAFWTGLAGTGGSLEVWVSNLPDLTTFAEYPSSITALPLANPGCNSVLWNIAFAGFRYAVVKYVKGSITAGTLSIVALGKQ